jgi:hypothetical protein
MTAKIIWDTLSQIDVSNHIEKKNNLSYLSWAWAWGTLMKHYPDTSYSFTDRTFPDGTMEISCTVTILAPDASSLVQHFMWLPVMNHKNQAISNPDAFQINTAKMRCLTKCLAMFGLGHYIYAGEDLPEVEQEKLSQPVNDDQYQIVMDLLVETDSNITNFCKHFKIKEVVNLKQSDFERAKTALEAKLEQSK